MVFWHFYIEYGKTQENLKKDWDALKKACRPYKNILDIHIDTEMIDELEHVTVTFFWGENHLDQKFFVVLIYQDNCWKGI